MNTETTPAPRSEMPVLNIFGKHEVDNYPYGSLRTKMFYWIEFKPKFGFRPVSQTINPKNGKLNAPKPGNYHPFACHVQNPANNHIEVFALSLNGYESVQKGCRWLAKNFDAVAMSSDMVKYVCTTALDSLIVSMAWTKVANREALRALMSGTLDLLREGKETGRNVFTSLDVPVEAVREMEKEAENQPK